MLKQDKQGKQIFLFPNLTNLGETETNRPQKRRKRKRRKIVYFVLTVRMQVL